MGDERVNRHLHRARERLENLPSRAVEQEWETSDPLLSETLTVMAHAMIAQAEINQEALWEAKALNQKIDNIQVQAYYYKTPYSEISSMARDEAKRAVEQEVKRQMDGQESFVEQLIRQIFGRMK